VRIIVCFINLTKNSVFANSPTKCCLPMARVFWTAIAIALVFSNWVDGFEGYYEHQFNETELSLLEAHEASLSYAGSNLLLVGLTLVQNAAAKGAGNHLVQTFVILFIFHFISK